MTGRHRAEDGSTDPYPVATTAPVRPIADLADWENVWRETDPDEWLAPLRSGGTQIERAMRRTMRARGQLLAERVGRRAARMRAAFWKGEGEQ
ncbi:hypothetical protein C1I98_11025 [Spongiactinospora gelatinilytica]|uniref:Uncharacterized protein n=1 Tax=Spongiactinospora gelatinilytica TaxID=2666298 RepID=A0A2W2GMM8_9ACTN|nr:hypothetical protein [Spongiactinospora gelatinilytica]PZG49841.1 hypothetical protein C1I98_11025 [Spongiactinospora gelatinilytica]